MLINVAFSEGVSPKYSFEPEYENGFLTHVWNASRHIDLIAQSTLSAYRWLFYLYSVNMYLTYFGCCFTKKAGPWKVFSPREA